MRTAPALLIVLAATLALVGCVPDDDPIVLDPDPSVSPIFESDEEALAAAEAAYAEYLEISDQVLNDGGKNPERLLAVVSEELYQQAAEGFESMESGGLHGVGLTRYDSAVLQSYFADALPGEQIIAIYVCVDLSGLDVVDANGTSVVSPARIERSPYVVGFASVDFDDPSLLVSSDEPWDGEDFCVV